MTGGHLLGQWILETFVFHLHKLNEKILHFWTNVWGLGIPRLSTLILGWRDDSGRTITEKKLRNPNQDPGEYPLRNKSVPIQSSIQQNLLDFCVHKNSILIIRYLSVEGKLRWWGLLEGIFL